MASKSSLEIVERDEAGNVTATYIQSTSSNKTETTSRIDVLLPQTTKSIWQQTLDVFLPAGYPQSVTNDYLEYQIYDSLQAFSSSIASLLSSRAVLSSVGVGDSTASPTSALLLSVLQESAGRLATIAFAHRLGTALEPECKMYRLLADVLNDFAFVIDTLSPIFPKPARVAILSCSSVLRALCGVAAGSAKASLSAHFAQQGNLGELNAKDASQETVISLLGMLVGTVVVSMVTGPVATWTMLIFLLSIHLETNRRAVRAVKMRALSRQRATLVYHQLCRNHVPSPDEISAQEHIFERDGILRDVHGIRRGTCSLGVSTNVWLNCFAPRHGVTNSIQIEAEDFQQLLDIFHDRRYVIGFVSRVSASSTVTDVYVVFKSEATTRDVLEAWWAALIIAESQDTQSLSVVLSSAVTRAKSLLERHQADLESKGWDLEIDALETRSKIRVDINS
ncbi:DUF647-domain-containing protein [Acrodontium crateriforme]|uniref:DUF647-domain-containing protein n=1 Tax=Acrodontium crateriforme TaxID=150365 RepID=A0AAQ3LYQ9_9PEZI|nr:DUF647-domain-containing protein [Acrodontium crateriforme]